MTDSLPSLPAITPNPSPASLTHVNPVGIATPLYLPPPYQRLRGNSSSQGGGGSFGGGNIGNITGMNGNGGGNGGDGRSSIVGRLPVECTTRLPNASNARDSHLLPSLCNLLSQPSSSILFAYWLQGQILGTFHTVDLASHLVHFTQDNPPLATYACELYQTYCTSASPYPVTCEVHSSTLEALFTVLEDAQMQNRSIQAVQNLNHPHVMSSTNTNATGSSATPSLSHSSSNASASISTSQAGACYPSSTPVAPAVLPTPDTELHYTLFDALLDEILVYLLPHFMYYTHSSEYTYSAIERILLSKDEDLVPPVSVIQQQQQQQQQQIHAASPSLSPPLPPSISHLPPSTYASMTSGSSALLYSVCQSRYIEELPLFVLDFHAFRQRMNLIPPKLLTEIKRYEIERKRIVNANAQAALQAQQGSGHGGGGTHGHSNHPNPLTITASAGLAHHQSTAASVNMAAALEDGYNLDANSESSWILASKHQKLMEEWCGGAPPVMGMNGSYGGGGYQQPQSTTKSHSSSQSTSFLTGPSSNSISTSSLTGVLGLNPSTTPPPPSSSLSDICYLIPRPRGSLPPLTYRSESIHIPTFIQARLCEVHLLYEKYLQPSKSQQRHLMNSSSSSSLIPRYLQSSFLQMSHSTSVHNQMMLHHPTPHNSSSLSIRSPHAPPNPRYQNNVHAEFALKDLPYYLLRDLLDTYSMALKYQYISSELITALQKISLWCIRDMFLRKNILYIFYEEMHFGRGKGLGLAHGKIFKESWIQWQAGQQQQQGNRKALASTTSSTSDEESGTRSLTNLLPPALASTSVPTPPDVLLAMKAADLLTHTQGGRLHHRRARSDGDLPALQEWWMQMDEPGNASGLGGGVHQQNHHHNHHPTTAAAVLHARTSSALMSLASPSVSASPPLPTPSPKPAGGVVAGDPSALMPSASPPLEDFPLSSLSSGFLEATSHGGILSRFLPSRSPEESPVTSPEHPSSPSSRGMSMSVSGVNGGSTAMMNGGMMMNGTGSMHNSPLTNSMNGRVHRVTSGSVSGYAPSHTSSGHTSSSSSSSLLPALPFLPPQRTFQFGSVALYRKHLLGLSKQAAEKEEELAGRGMIAAAAHAAATAAQQAQQIAAVKQGKKGGKGGFNSNPNGVLLPPASLSAPGGGASSSISPVVSPRSGSIASNPLFSSTLGLSSKFSSHSLHHSHHLPGHPHVPFIHYRSVDDTDARFLQYLPSTSHIQYGGVQLSQAEYEEAVLKRVQLYEHMQSMRHIPLPVQVEPVTPPVVVVPQPQQQPQQVIVQPTPVPSSRATISFMPGQQQHPQNNRHQHNASHTTAPIPTHPPPFRAAHSAEVTSGAGVHAFSVPPSPAHGQSAAAQAGFPTMTRSNAMSVVAPGPGGVVPGHSRSRHSRGHTRSQSYTQFASSLVAQAALAAPGVTSSSVSAASSPNTSAFNSAAAAAIRAKNRSVRFSANARHEVREFDAEDETDGGSTTSPQPPSNSKHDVSSASAATQALSGERTRIVGHRKTPSFNGAARSILKQTYVSGDESPVISVRTVRAASGVGQNKPAGAAGQHLHEPLSPPTVPVPPSSPTTNPLGAIVPSHRQLSYHESMRHIYEQRQAETSRLLSILSRGAVFQKYQERTTNQNSSSTAPPKCDYRFFYINSAVDASELSWCKLVNTTKTKSAANEGLNIITINGQKKKPQKESLFNKHKTKLLADGLRLFPDSFHSSQFIVYNQVHNLPPWLCLTLLFTDRSLDLIALNESQAQDWFFGLQSLIPLNPSFKSKSMYLWNRMRLKIQYYAAKAVPQQSIATYCRLLITKARSDLEQERQQEREEQEKEQANMQHLVIQRPDDNEEDDQEENTTAALNAEKDAAARKASVSTRAATPRNANTKK